MSLSVTFSSYFFQTRKENKRDVDGFTIEIEVKVGQVKMRAVTSCPIQVVSCIKQIINFPIIFLLILFLNLFIK